LWYGLETKLKADSNSQKAICENCDFKISDLGSGTGNTKPLKLMGACSKDRHFVQANKGFIAVNLQIVVMWPTDNANVLMF